MSLLAPALLLGLLGLCLPILAHLLGRERPRDVPFAALRFLPAADPAVSHRRVLRDRVLLGVRLALLALLVVAMARPVTEDRGGVNVVAEVHDAVVLVDASASMAMEVGGRSLMSHALEHVETLMRALPSGSRVGLLTSDPDGPRVEPTADPSAIVAALEQWLEDGAPRPGAWELKESLPSAIAMLQELGDAQRTRAIYAVGDASTRGLAGLPNVGEGGAILVPVLATQRPIPEQISIQSATWEAAPELDPKAVRVRAVLRLVPGSEEPAASPRSVGLVLRIAQAEVARTVVDLVPSEDTVVDFTHTLLDATEAAATVELLDAEDDPYPVDNARHLWVAADDGMEVVVVNGDPSELRAHDEVYFLSTAIGATSDQRRAGVRSLAPDQLDDAVRTQGDSALENTDVLVLSNVRAPAPDVAAAIVENVKRGMGLWITVGNRVDEEAFNERLRAVLPLRLREAVQVGTAPGRTEARVEGLSAPNLAHPIFRGLSGDLGLGGTRARRIVLLEPDPQKGAQIALSFTSGAPALLTTKVGEGRAALLTTTIDRDWSDLPLRPGYVPLVGGVLSYLGGADGGSPTTSVEVGQPRPLRAHEPVTVHTPDGRQVSVAPQDGVATFDDTYVAGHYRAQLGRGRGAVFVVGVSALESGTTPQALRATESVGPSRQVAVSVPRWRWLMLLAAIALAIEAGLRWAKRSPLSPTRS